MNHTIDSLGTGNIVAVGIDFFRGNLKYMEQKGNAMYFPFLREEKIVVRHWTKQIGSFINFLLKFLHFTAPKKFSFPFGLTSYLPYKKYEKSMPEWCTKLAPTEIQHEFEPPSLWSASSLQRLFSNCRPRNLQTLDFVCDNAI